MLTFISREDALRQGLKRYFTGEPCKYGHVSQRFSKCRACVACHDKRNTETYRRRKESGDDARASIRRWHERHPDKSASYSKAWRSRNPERVRARMAEWERKNTEKRLEIRRRRADLKRDEINAKFRLWERANRRRRVAKSTFRKTRVRNATPKWADRKRLYEVYENCPQGMHVDHVVPLVSNRVCGLHVPWNLQYLSAEENLRKGNQL